MLERLGAIYLTDAIRFRREELLGAERLSEGMLRQLRGTLVARGVPVPRDWKAERKPSRRAAWADLIALARAGLL